MNPVVDFYNHYGLRHMVPMGAYNMNGVTGNLRLCFAEKDLEFIGIG
jgi:DNA/RNA-binding domain of Phe-tRNA-synthetase-like protein